MRLKSKVTFSDCWKSLIILVIFVIQWQNANQHVNLQIRKSIVTVNSAYSGYGYLVNITTLNVLLMLILFKPLRTQHFLVRKTRSDYAWTLIRQIALLALWSAFLFVFVSVYENIRHFTLTTLIDVHYFQITGFYFAALLSFYLVMGAIFLMIYLYFQNYPIALFGIFAVGILMIIMNFTFNFQPPVSVVYAYDYFWVGTENVSIYVFKIVKNLLLCCLGFWVVHMQCARQDVIHA